jgi:hypothetical protein
VLKKPVEIHVIKIKLDNTCSGIFLKRVFLQFKSTRC